MGLFERKGREKSREAEITVDEEDEEEAPAPPRTSTVPGLDPGRAAAHSPMPANVAARSAGAGRGYGIEQVVELLRALPWEQNSDLIGEVVRRTLESAHVSIESILADAREREEEIHKRIVALTQAIEEMQREVGARRKHVADLQKQLGDIIKARDLLAAPVKLRGGVPAAEASGEEAGAARQSRAPAADATRGEHRPADEVAPPDGRGRRT